MTAFVVARTTVRDPEKMKRYAASAAPTIATHGGRIVLRGGFAKSLLGSGASHGTAVMEFPDLAAVDAWFGSDAYQALASLRDEACDMTLFAYQAPSA